MNADVPLTVLDTVLPLAEVYGKVAFGPGS
jgi:hypothetical protein